MVFLMLGKLPKNFKSVFWRQICYWLKTLMDPREGQFTFVFDFPDTSFEVEVW